jgi:hypothetical protein
LYYMLQKKISLLRARHLIYWKIFYWISTNNNVIYPEINY